MGKQRGPGTSLSLRLCPGQAGVPASLEDENRSGALWPVSFKFKEYGAFVLADVVCNMHGNLLEWNNILPIILMYKVFIMLRNKNLECSTGSQT